MPASKLIDSALPGVRVVELSQFAGGSSCAEFLAWLGADVVKVEPPAGASGRCANEHEPGVDSYDFILLNANKRSVTCDLESKRGKADFGKLLAKADVVIVHLAPNAIERLGFAYDTVRQINPRIIFAQISGFASDGPRAKFLSSDQVAQASGGALSGTGYKGGTPLIPGPNIADTGAALHCVIGILAALHQRHITMRGQSVEVAMQHAVINLNRTAYRSQLTQGKPPERTGNAARTSAVPGNLFPCKPGGPNDYVIIHIQKSAARHWQGLLKAIGREDLENDPDFADSEARVRHRGEVDALVAGWCSKHTKIEAMEAIQGEGAPAGAVLDMHDLGNDPDLRKRGMFVTVQHPVRGAVTMPAWPVKMSESHVPVKCAPFLGAHTEEVFSEWLAPSEEGAPVSAGEPPQIPGMNQALSGVRIVDLTQFEAGPSCTEALAWLGADVVKVEQPERGERGRFASTDKPGVDAHYFLLMNANKRSLTCDLKSKQGKEILRRLIAAADVMVENMAPGVIERLGFGYDVVRQINPRIIFAQIKGFPPDGSHADYLCFDMIAQSVGGALSLTGATGEPPLRSGPNLGDTGAGIHCATGILAALCQRHRTGRGQRIDVAMQESVINFCRTAFARFLSSGKPPERSGNRSLYQCKGGGPNDYCFIYTSGASDEQWQRLLRAIGRQELIDDPSFAGARERGKHGEAIDALLRAWCRERSKTEVMDVVQSAGVPAGAVFDTKDLINDPDLRKSGMFVEIAHPVRGAVTIPAWPVKLSESHVPVRSAPLLGVHTAEVLSEWLGLSMEEIHEFHKSEPAEG